VQYHQQLGVNDCGPACLAMIASHYGSRLSAGEIRNLCKTDSMGTNLNGLIAAAEKLGFDAKAFKGERANKTLDEKLLFPFVAHIKIVYLERTYDHFVVIKSISKAGVEIWDPNPAEGRHVVGREEFLKIWTGYVLFLSPDDHFTPQKEKTVFLFKYAPLPPPHKNVIGAVCAASALLIIFGIINSFYYKYVIDEVVVAKAKFSLAALSIGILSIAVVQSIVETLRGMLINHFVYKAGLQLNFSYIAHLLKLPVSVFETRRTGEILSRLGDMTEIREALSGATLSIIMDSVLLLVIGPYNANQKNYNNQNANRPYPKIDKRIRETFTKESKAQKKKYEDMYLRFYRWAMDRLDNKNGGVVAFVSNRSFVDAINTDGFRAVVGKEFDYLYILDTQSDVRKNPKISGTKNTVFGIQTGVALMFAVKCPHDPQAKSVVHYYTMRDEDTREEKLQFLKHNPLNTVPWTRIYPDKHNNWLNISTTDYNDLLPLVADNGTGVFYQCFPGVSTNRNDWVYDFSSKSLSKKVKYFIRTYNKSIAENKMDVSIKWSETMKVIILQKNINANPREKKGSENLLYLG
jgi:predicted double-glycine peptidase